MLNTLKTYSLRTSSLLAVLVLAACGNLSQVTNKGTTDEPVWPNPADTSFDAGSYPEIENLKLIGPGMTKDQFYNLLGRPHFAEGFAGVREWDYLFHFRTPSGDVSCQYKILFDQDKKAQSFFWKPSSCANFIQNKQATVVAPATPAPQAFSLNSDVLFAFNSATLTAAGQGEVKRVAAELASHDTQVTIVGHTDRIGSDVANQGLSLRRAQAVRLALMENGISSKRIVAHGVGETQPVVQCAKRDRTAEIACLAPNRRVDITAR